MKKRIFTLATTTILAASALSCVNAQEKQFSVSGGIMFLKQGTIGSNSKNTTDLAKAFEKDKTDFVADLSKGIFIQGDYPLIGNASFGSRLEYIKSNFTRTDKDPKDATKELANKKEVTSIALFATASYDFEVAEDFDVKLQGSIGAARNYNGKADSNSKKSSKSATTTPSKDSSENNLAYKISLVFSYELTDAMSFFAKGSYNHFGEIKEHEAKTDTDKSFDENATIGGFGGSAGVQFKL